MNEKFRKNFYNMFFGFTICFDFFPQVEGDKVERLSERSSCVPMVARLYHCTLWDAHNKDCEASERHLRPVPMPCNSRRNASFQSKECFLTPQRKHLDGGWKCLRQL